jgi:hypothetical protein
MMIAFTVPILPDKVDAWKAWMRECATARKNDFDRFNERMELTLHRAWLTQGPRGPWVIVVCDGPGAKGFLRRLASSREPFDTWFRERVTDVHGADIFKAGAPAAPEAFLDWTAPAYAEVGHQ